MGSITFLLVDYLQSGKPRWRINVKLPDIRADVDDLAEALQRPGDRPKLAEIEVAPQLLAGSPAEFVGPADHLSSLTGELHQLGSLVPCPHFARRNSATRST